MLKILIPAVASLGLVAHAAQSYAPTDGMPLPVAAVSGDLMPAGPVMDWHFHSDGDTARLAWGVANSDQLVLMLTCEAGQSAVSALGSVRAVAETATDQTSFDDPMTGDILHEARIARHDPVLSDLAETGKISVMSARGKVAVGTGDSDRTAIRRFLASCGSARG